MCGWVGRCGSSNLISHVLLTSCYCSPYARVGMFSWGLMCMQVQEPSSQQNLIFDEVTLGDSMPSEAVARALALLAKWALRRADREPEPKGVVITRDNSLIFK